QTGVKTVVNMSLAESMPLHIKTVFKLKAKVQKCEDFMSWKDFVALAEGQPPVKVFKFVPNRFSYLAHTGGTTGEPKGVMLTDEALNGIVEEHPNIFNFERRDHYLNTIVPFVVYGFLINTHVPLSLGLENVLIPKADITKIPSQIVKYKINFIATVPPYLEHMSKDKKVLKTDLSFVKALIAGGDGMTDELENSINNVLKAQGADITVMNGYGLTEICATSCGNFKKYFKGSVGYPLNRNVFAVFDIDTNEELKYGETGEICINTPYLMLGYLKNPEATAEVVKTHADGKKWFHTGDLGYITEEGAVYITGRIKRIILTEKDGMVSKIFPDRVEKLLDSHKAVEVSCVVKQSGEAAEVKLTAHIVLKEQYRTETARIEQELRKLCAAELPEYSVPDRYAFRESMPLTAAGKVDFRTLEKMAEEEN
ncbi:MAG: long-chain fatty acid--CoA ligase, partial [Ruminococcus sp.]|nr:long-chain fatty acid--CoA ligase [Ruminococcus sp.]